MRISKLQNGFTSAIVLATAALSVNAFAAKTEKTTTTVKTEKTTSTETKIAFDPAASIVKWEGKKVTGQHNGTIKITKGEIDLAGKDLKSGEFTIDMNSIQDEDLKDATYNTKLVTHLKSEDFFDVAKYPTAVLKIKDAKSVEGIAGPTYEVTADLTLKGKTNEIKFPAVVKTKDGKSTATANITIDRTRWDVKYGSGKFFKGLGDKVVYDDFKLDVVLATK